MSDEKNDEVTPAEEEEQENNDVPKSNASKSPKPKVNHTI